MVAISLLAIALIPITIEIFERVSRIPLQMSPLAVADVVVSMIAPLMAGMGGEATRSITSDRGRSAIVAISFTRRARSLYSGCP
jgi:hypothetical protein